MLTNNKKILNIFLEISDQVEKHLISNKNSKLNIFYKKDSFNNKEAFTNLDKNIEKICITNIKKEFKNVQIISEENYNPNTSYDDKSYFVIDPIDGTTELIKGSDNWSLSIAYIAKGKPVVAMLYFPYKHIKIYALQNEGIQINQKIVYNKNIEEPIKLGISPRQIKCKNILEHLNKHNLQTIQVPTFTTKILYLILGKIDAAVYFPQKNKSARLWDYAAAVLLLEEMKYKITSLDGQNLKFDGQDIEHAKGWLASRKNKHKNLLNKLQLKIK